MTAICRWRVDRTVARIALAGLATSLALFFVAGWMVGAHIPAGGEVADPFVAVPERDIPERDIPEREIETAPEEEPLPLRRHETVRPERSAPPAPSPQPASRWASAWKVPSRTAPVRTASYGSLIREAAVRHSLSPSLVEAMARVESGFNPAAVSRKGARGLLQVLPATARRFGFRSDRLFEPAHNLAAGTAYLAWLLDRFGGNLDFALAAYNAGEGAVDDHGGIPPFRETREYVRRVKALLGSEPPAGEQAIPGELPPVTFDQRLEDNWKALGFAAGPAPAGDLQPPLADVPFQEPHENCFGAAPIETRTAEADHGAPHSGEGHRALVWRPH